ncbi:hypothetical protein D3C84_679410 [compost metagenome]
MGAVDGEHVQVFDQGDGEVGAGHVLVRDKGQVSNLHALLLVPYLPWLEVGLLVSAQQVAADHHD